MACLKHHDNPTDNVDSYWSWDAPKGLLSMSLQLRNFGSQQTTPKKEQNLETRMTYLQCVNPFPRDPPMNLSTVSEGNWTLLTYITVSNTSPYLRKYDWIPRDSKHQTRTNQINRSLSLPCRRLTGKVPCPQMRAPTGTKGALSPGNKSKGAPASSADSNQRQHLQIRFFSMDVLKGTSTANNGFHSKLWLSL